MKIIQGSPFCFAPMRFFSLLLQLAALALGGSRVLRWGKQPILAPGFFGFEAPGGRDALVVPGSQGGRGFWGDKAEKISLATVLLFLEFREIIGWAAVFFLLRQNGAGGT